MTEFSLDFTSMAPPCDPDTWRQEIHEDGSVTYFDAETGDVCVELAPAQSESREPASTTSPNSTESEAIVAQTPSHAEALAYTGSGEPLGLIGASVFLVAVGREAIRYGKRREARAYLSRI